MYCGTQRVGEEHVRLPVAEPPPLVMMTLPFHGTSFARLRSSSASAFVLKATKAIVTIGA